MPEEETTASQSSVKRGNAYIEGNAEFFILLLLILGGTLVGIVWGVGWTIVRLFG